MFVSGRVHGVGFRYATRTLATQLGLAGWVRNLPDGRVEAFFSGEMSALKQMLDWCESGPRMATVTNIEHEWRTDECQYSGFQIKG